MGTPFEDVWDFHEAFDFPRSEVPALPPEEVRALRLRLIREELAEFIEAESGGDMSAIAHELADLLYVLYGTAVSYGIPMDEVFREVHAANMSKSKPQDGAKAVKGPGYVKPNVRSILEARANTLK